MIKFLKDHYQQEIKKIELPENIKDIKKDDLSDLIIDTIDDRTKEGWKKIEIDRLIEKGKLTFRDDPPCKHGEKNDCWCSLHPDRA